MLRFWMRFDGRGVRTEGGAMMGRRGDGGLWEGGKKRGKRGKRGRKQGTEEANLGFIQGFAVFSPSHD